MLFTPKSKGFFVERNSHSLLIARTSGMGAPLVVEHLEACAVGDDAARDEILLRLQRKKTPSGYVHAACSIFADRQLVRLVPLELKRVKEPGYLVELCAAQCRIDPATYALAVLNPDDGTDYDPGKSPAKEVLFCGLPREDVVTAQNDLLLKGFYPERLELGSVAQLGAVVDYLKHGNQKLATLVLEIGEEITQAFIVAPSGVEATRPIPTGLAAMLPLVQKELGLKDEEAARKLFYANTFDFTGMGPTLIKKLLKELQSSIGFYEVQTGQSVSQMLCTQLPGAVAWLEGTIASSLGVAVLKPDFTPWLTARGITLADQLKSAATEARWFGLFGLMARYDLDHVAETAEAKA